MHHTTFRLLLALAMGTACSQDIALTQNAVCDGQKQAGEDTVDAPFDRDGDGFFDASNPDCQRVYSPAVLDCNDGDEGVHPAALEVECNGLDDDCNANTPDTADVDKDGSNACDDCNDNEPLQSPDLEEQCDDDLDNNCDGQVNEDCGPEDYDDLWVLDRAVRYSCTFGPVNIDFDQLDIRDSNPNMTMSSVGSGGQPGTMSGSISGTDVTVDRVLTGSCEEQYELTGTFTDKYTLQGTFTAKFVGGSGCFDCTDQTFAVTATRP